MSEDENALSVQVAVRVRPAFGHQKHDSVCVSVPDATESYKNGEDRYQTIRIGEGESKKDFTFDHVFPPSTRQLQMYTKCVKPLIHSCLDGYNATIFAYGQSGSGKTHTIVGDLDFESGSILNDGDDEMIGVIPRALMEIFGGLNKRVQQQQSGESTAPSRTSLRNILDHSKEPQSTDLSSTQPFEYQVKAQFLELYGEDINDLFVKDRDNSPKITLRDGKPGEDAQVRGVIQREVKSAEEALRYLQEGMEMRKVDKTALNAVSSRSHCIFTLLIQQIERKLADNANGSRNDRQLVEMKTSKIHIVDLAGSEKIKKAQTQGQRLKEGININKGLFVLGNVISALGNDSNKKKQHVPYRDSKLTRLLKGSLGGNHKTLMIACVSPVLPNQEETLGTLRYANRAKNIKNKAKINIDPVARVMKELRGQVNTLAEELLRLRTTSGIDVEDDCPFSVEFLEELLHKKKWRASIIPPGQSSPFATLKAPTTMENQSTIHDENIENRSVLTSDQSSDAEENDGGSVSNSTNSNVRPPTLMKSALFKSVMFNIPEEGTFEDSEREDNIPDSTSLSSNKDADKMHSSMSTKATELEDEEIILYEDAYGANFNLVGSEFRINEEEEIVLYDDMRRSMLHFIGDARVETLLESSMKEQRTPYDDDSFSSSATEERNRINSEVEPEISSSLFESFISGHTPQYSTHMPEYGERYRVLLLKWQIRLIDTEIQNRKEQKKYFKSIMIVPNQSSSHVSISVKDIEEKIIDLKKDRKGLLQLSKRKSSQSLDTFEDDVPIKKHRVPLMRRVGTSSCPSLFLAYLKFISPSRMAQSYRKFSNSFKTPR